MGPTWTSLLWPHMGCSLDKPTVGSPTKLPLGKEEGPKNPKTKLAYKEPHMCSPVFISIVDLTIQNQKHKTAVSPIRVHLTNPRVWFVPPRKFHRLPTADHCGLKHLPKTCQTSLQQVLGGWAISIR